MLKLRIIFALIVGIQIIGYGQWEEKNIMTKYTLTSVDFVTENFGFVTGGNRIYRTDNGGDDWLLSHTASDLVFYEDIFAIDNDVIIAVGKDFNSNQSVISKTINGGANWSETTITNSTFLRAVFFVTSEIGFCSGGGGTILKSIDSGNNWEELNSGTGTNLQSIFFVNEMVGVAVGGSPLSAVILKTQNGGVNWDLMNSPSSNNLQSVYFTNQETGYVVGWNGEIMKTDNCGDDWTIQTSVAMTGNLEVIFTNDKTGYIVGGTANESLIQKTTNGGNLWQDVSPQISEGLSCIHFPSFKYGYAVGSNGTVVKTESGGIMTSTNNLDIINEFMVFPNPTNGILNIESERRKKIEKIRIYNSDGGLINEPNLFFINSYIDLSNLESNVYYLEIHSEGRKEIKRVVKK